MREYKSCVIGIHWDEVDPASYSGVYVGDTVYNTGNPEADMRAAIQDHDGYHMLLSSSLDWFLAKVVP